MRSEKILLFVIVHFMLQESKEQRHLVSCAQSGLFTYRHVGEPGCITTEAAAPSQSTSREIETTSRSCCTSGRNDGGLKF